MAKVGKKPRIFDPDGFFKDFPALDRKFRNFTVTSHATERYNCIAFAAGDHDHWWWPVTGVRGAVWPEGCARIVSLDAFVAAFESLGYTVCENGNLEDGVEKVAIYQNGEEPTHAARQMRDRNGRWKSKIGDNVDIEHELAGLEGGSIYGVVVKFMCRPTTHSARRRAKKKKR
jgi:hypothetical protein